MDMVLVNCYIVYNLVQKKHLKKAIDHNKFFRQMHAALIEVTAEDFSAGLTRNAAPARAAGSVVAAAHELEEMNDMRDGTNSINQRRQRACKVCSMLKVSQGAMQLLY